MRVVAPTLVETGLVVAGHRGGKNGPELQNLLRELGATVAAFGEAEWHAAVRHERYGRGRHRAGLNFGDCLAYATAAVAGESLLFVGADFPAPTSRLHS